VTAGWLYARSNHEIEQQADNQYTVFASYQARLKVSLTSTGCPRSICATAHASTPVAAHAV
jgi:hypothetical protein